MNKKIIIFVISILFLSPIFSTAEKITKPSTIKLSKDQTTVPTWNPGNSWTYNFFMEDEFGDAFEFSWHSNTLKFTVHSDAESYYEMDVTGDLNGEITISGSQIIKGQLKDTTISGSASVDKSNIGITNLDITIKGKIAVSGIPVKSFTLDVMVSFSPAYNTVKFPLEIGDKYKVPVSDVEGKASLSLLKNPIYIDEIIGGDDSECVGMESQDVGAGTFNSYKIISEADVSEIYYAEKAGNIIKAYGDSVNFVDISLISTNYGYDQGAPTQPIKPEGPTSGSTGESYSYKSSTTDPEDNQIYYLFDWGDGSDSGWIGPYDSGEEVTASHKWNIKGDHKVRVKAKDTENHESPWSNYLSVSIPRNKLFLQEFIENLYEKFPKICCILDFLIYNKISF